MSTKPGPWTPLPSTSPRFEALLGRTRTGTLHGALVQHLRPPRLVPRTVLQPLPERVDGERTLTGRGEVYTFTIVHKPAPGFEVAALYVFAYVRPSGRAYRPGQHLRPDHLLTCSRFPGHRV